MACLVWGAGAVLAAPAAAQAPGPVSLRSAQNAQLGALLVDAQGKTLYRFTRDEGSTSTCYDQCAQTWPPLLVSSGQATLVGIGGTVGTTVRTDGTRQVTYNGVPVYYYSRDVAIGEVNGQGVGGVWFVVNTTAAVALPRTGGGPAPVRGLAALAGAIVLAAGFGLRRVHR
jgi:predicted lipoprotein with Yx(FWY)xxD motif